MKTSPHKFKFLWLRRITQILTLGGLIAIALLSSNPYEWSPSRIVLGHLPPPVVIPLSGDTWAFRIYDFNLIHPVAFVEVALASKTIYLPLVVAVLIPFTITVVFGRVFCSFMCPAGLLFELNQKTNQLAQKLGLNRQVNIRDIRVLLLAIILLLVVLLSTPVVSLFDPPHVIGREFVYLFSHHSLSLSGTGLILLILLYETFFTSRTWCNSICPSGGGLSVLGAKRLLRIKMDKALCIFCEKCNQACPYYLQPMKLAKEEHFDWTKCDNCGLCRDICPTRAITFKFSK